MYHTYGMIYKKLVRVVGRELGDWRTEVKKGGFAFTVYPFVSFEFCTICMY